MNILLITMLVVVGAFLTWLVVTDKIKLPVLTDFGVAAVIIGLIVWADAYEAHDDPLKPWGVTIISLGVGLLIASHYRQRALRRKALRIGDPKEIDGRHFTRITGGKQ